MAAAKARFADDPEAEEALARGYTAGGYPEAMRLAAETLAARSRTTYVQPTGIASLYAYAGDSDRALEWLEKAHDERDPVLVGLSVAPKWDSLRDDPRFQELRRRMNLPQ